MILRMVIDHYLPCINTAYDSSTLAAHYTQQSSHAMSLNIPPQESLKLLITPHLHAQNLIINHPKPPPLILSKATRNKESLLNAPPSPLPSFTPPKSPFPPPTSLPTTPHSLSGLSSLASPTISFYVAVTLCTYRKRSRTCGCSDFSSATATAAPMDSTAVMLRTLSPPSNSGVGPSSCVFTNQPYAHARSSPSVCP